MTDNEVITLALSATSLGVSVIAILKSSSASSAANTIAAENLKLMHAQVEIDLRNQINESRRSVEEFYESNGDFLARAIGSLTEEEQRKRERLKSSAASLIEGYVSALDTACQKYIDGKIDKIRFKKGYQREVRQAVQDESHKDFFRVGHGYHALIRVYDEWENPERT
jgi:hypothetical protein